MSNLVFLPQDESASLYEAVKVLKGNNGGIVVGKNIPAICVIEYLQLKEAL